MIVEDNFFSRINLQCWFTRVGKPVGTSTNVLVANNQVKDIDQAVKIWQGEFDNRCDKWELLRVKLINNKEWLDGFHDFRSSLFEKLKEQQSIVDFVEILRAQFIIDEEQFFSELPFIGGWGEHILNIKSGYYQNQFQFYETGYWPCKLSHNYCLFY